MRAMTSTRLQGAMIAQAVKYAHASTPNDFTNGVVRGLCLSLAMQVIDNPTPSHDVVAAIDAVVRDLPDTGLRVYSSSSVAAFRRHVREIEAATW